MNDATRYYHTLDVRPARITKWPSYQEQAEGVDTSRFDSGIECVSPNNEGTHCTNPAMCWNIEVSTNETTIMRDYKAPKPHGQLCVDCSEGVYARQSFGTFYDVDKMNHDGTSGGIVYQHDACPMWNE